MEDDVIIDLEAMIKDGKDGFLSPTCCIYRVPQIIRNLKKDAYTPKVASIGPFHNGDVLLQEMERHKQIFFKSFIQEAMTSLDDLVNFVKHLEPKVRASYLENIEFSEKEPVKVILVDAAFIIQLFRKIYKKLRLENDFKLSQIWLVNAIIMDLLLLENQLPFFFLEELFKRAFPPDLCRNVPSFLELTYDFFSSFNNQQLEPNPDVRIKHFTDLLRFFHLPRQEPQRCSLEDERSNTLLYSANELQEARVKFNATTGNCILDLKFNGHVLEVPQILVDGNIETLFRNMIALEQCHYPKAPYITDYADMRRCLMKKNEDVDVLIERKIINTYLPRTNDVVEIFNGLVKNTCREDINCDYQDIFQKLHGFYEDPWNKKIATLRHDYFNTPWRTVASIAGIVVLVLSLVQTIFSILQVVVK